MKKGKKWDSEEWLMMGDTIFKVLFAVLIVGFFSAIMFFFMQMVDVQISLLKLFTGAE